MTRHKILHQNHNDHVVVVAVAVVVVDGSREVGVGGGVESHHDAVVKTALYPRRRRTNLQVRARKIERRRDLLRGKTERSVVRHRSPSVQEAGRDTELPSLLSRVGDWLLIFWCEDVGGAGGGGGIGEAKQERSFMCETCTSSIRTDGNERPSL